MANTAVEARKPGHLEIRKARTRAAILHAASRLFRTQGFDATSIQQIATMASTGIGTVYGYFDSKEGLLEEVLRTGTEEAVRRYQQTVDEQTPAIDRLCTALDMLAAFVGEHRTILLAAFRTAGRERRLDQRTAGWLLEAVRGLIRDGIDRGELRPVPVATASRLLISAYAEAFLEIGTWRGREDDATTLAGLRELTRALLLPEAAGQGLPAAG